MPRKPPSGGDTAAPAGTQRRSLPHRPRDPRSHLLGLLGGSPRPGPSGRRPRDPPGQLQPPASAPRTEAGSGDPRVPGEGERGPEGPRGAEPRPRRRSRGARPRELRGAGPSRTEGPGERERDPESPGELSPRFTEGRRERRPGPDAVIPAAAGRGPAPGQSPRQIGRAQV